MNPKQNIPTSNSGYIPIITQAIKQQKPRNYLQMASQKWNQAFNPQRSQMQAFKQYLRYFMLKPPQLIKAQSDEHAMISTLLTLPFTIPTAIIASPLFLIGRTKLLIDKKIQQHDNKLIQHTLNKFYTQKTHFLTEVKAYQHAISSKLIANKKRLILLYPMDDKSKDKSQRQFMAVVGEDQNLMKLVTMVRQKVFKQHEKESLHLFHDSRVINPTLKVGKLSSDQMGVVKMGYVYIETFG